MQKNYQLFQKALTNQQANKILQSNLYFIFTQTKCSLSCFINVYIFHFSYQIYQSCNQQTIGFMSNLSACSHFKKQNEQIHLNSQIVFNSEDLLDEKEIIKDIIQNQTQGLIFQPNLSNINRSHSQKQQFFKRYFEHFYFLSDKSKQFIDSSSVQKAKQNNFREWNLNRQNYRKQSEEKLLLNNFIILGPLNNQQQKFDKIYQLKCKIIRKTISFQVFQIFCQLGVYSKRYTVLNNIQTESFRHNYQIIGLGTFGTIYCYENNIVEDRFSKKYAIKCLKFDTSNIYTLKNHIKQFFISDIMSAIQVGPKISRRSGFDFIIFADCIEYEMQICQKTQQQSYIEDLCQNLIRIHTLKIVHLDIKPINIMFSSFYNKNIFIDFGISQLLNQEIYQNIPTQFRGTYEYSGNEMKKIFFQKRAGMINLFINDIEALQNTIIKITKDSKSLFLQKFKNKQQQIQSNSKQSNFNQQLIIQLKFHLYSYNNLQKANQNFKQLFSTAMQIKDEHFQTYFIKNGLKFAQNLLNQSKQFIRNQFLKSNVQALRILNQSSILVDDESNFKDETHAMKKSEQIIIQLKKSICNRLQIQNLLKSFQKQSLRKNQKKNEKQSLQFILLNEVEAKKFTREVIFEMILKYVSFSRSFFKVSISKKQSVAAIMRSMIQKEKLVKQQTFNFFDKKYQSQSKFLSFQCQNLVWMYEHLINYCMIGQFNEFKANNLMVALKDSIFLSFKYQYFLEECLEMYLTHLISSNDKNLITNCIIQISQLIYLTEEHFLVQSKQQISFQKKNLMYNLKNIITNTIAHVQDCKYLTTYKTQILSQIWKIFKRLYSEELNYGQINIQKQQNYFRKVILEIQSEFSSNSKIEERQNYQKAMRIVFYQLTVRQNIWNSKRILITSPLSNLMPEHHSNLEKTDLIEIILTMRSKDRNFDTLKMIQLFDMRINCMQISSKFFLKQRLAQSIFKRDTSKTIQILNLIQSVEVALINYPIVYSIFANAQVLNLPKIQENLFYQKRFQIKKIKITKLLIKYFTKEIFVNLKPIMQCVYLLGRISSINIQNKRIQSIEQFKQINQINELYKIIKQTNDQQIQFLKSLYYKKIAGRQLQSMITSILLEFYQFYSKDHLQLKLQIYQDLLKCYNKSLNQLLIDKVKSTSEQISSHQKIVSDLFQSYNERRLKIFQQKNLSNRIQIMSTYQISNIVINQVQCFMKAISRHQLQIIYFQQLYWKVFKIKRYFYKMDRLFRELAYFTFFHAKNKAWNQIYQFLIQYCLQNMSLEQFNQLTKVMKHLKKTVGFDKHWFCQKMIAYLKQQSQFSQQEAKFLPIYLNLLQFQEYIQNVKVKKYLILKILFNYPRFLELLKKNNQTKNIINQISNFFMEQIYLFSMKLVSTQKKERKIQILRRIMIKYFGNYSFFDREQIKMHCIQFITCQAKYNQISFNQFKVKPNSEKNYFEILKQKMIVLGQKKRIKYLFNSILENQMREDLILKNYARKDVVDQLIQPNTVKLLVEGLIREQNKQNKYEILLRKEQFCQKYGLIQFELYQRWCQQALKRERNSFSEIESKGNNKFYFQNSQQSGLNKKQQYYNRFEQQSAVKKNVQLLKQTEQYKLFQSNYRTRMKLLQAQYQVFLRKFNIQYGKEMNYNQISWIIPK